MDLLNIPTLSTIFISAIVDSINPCAIGVMVLLLSMFVTLAYRRAKMLFMGLVYIGAIFIVYFLAGLGLSAFLSKIPQMIAVYISLFVALLVVCAGLVEIKDFFWYGRGFSLAIPPERAKQIEKLSRKLSFSSLVFLGAFVAGVELPCTGGPYLVITSILSQNFSWVAFWLLVIYNIIFVAPLVVVLFVVAFGHAKLHQVKRWKQDYRKFMRLGMGIVLILLGILLMMIADGTINLG